MKRSYNQVFGQGSASAKKRVRRNYTYVPRPRFMPVVKPQQSLRRALPYVATEKKFYDTFKVATAIPAPTAADGAEFDPSATSMITTPPQDDTSSGRNGKQIACLYLEIKGTITTDSLEAVVNPQNSCSVFVAVVLDSQTNGAQLNSEDVFSNPSANGRLASSPMRNLLFGPRFRILKQQKFNLSEQTLAMSTLNDFNSTGKEIPFSWFIPLKGMKVNFNAGLTASVANVIDNSIHVIAYANSTEVGPRIQYNARLRFVG